MATRRKPKAEETDEVRQPLLDPSSTEGFWQEFGQTFEHLSAEKAIVVLTLDRRTGRVEVDEIRSTPMETWAMVATLQTKLDSQLNATNGLELE